MRDVISFTIYTDLLYKLYVLIYFSLTVKAANLIFISGRGLAISSAKERKSGFIYNLGKSYAFWAAQTCVHFMKVLIVYIH